MALQNTTRYGSPMTLRIGIISDLHFGPRILFHGRLRKMSDMAPELTVAFVQRMNELKPDLVLTLGDIIEDESLETDANRYRHALRLLSEINAPVRHVCGNHDTINQTDDMIREAWNHQGELYYSFDCKGYHVSVLRTVERPHIDARLPSEQLEWLRKDLEQTTLPTVVACIMARPIRIFETTPGSKTLRKWLSSKKEKHCVPSFHRAHGYVSYSTDIFIGLMWEFTMPSHMSQSKA